MLEHRAERVLDDVGVELLAAEGGERLCPVDRLGDAGRLGEIEPAQAANEGGGLGGEPLRHARSAQPHDLDLALEAGMADPVEEAASLERVVQLPRPVRGQDDGRPALRPHGPELGDRDLEVRQHLEQERLELVVGAVDLVDQQHDRVRALDRLQQRPRDQELAPEELGLGDRAGLGRADVQQLPRVVPLVDGVGDIEPLVALEADQPGVERARAPSRPRSYRRRPRPRGARASRAVRRGRGPSRGRARAGTTLRGGPSSSIVAKATSAILGTA